MTVFCGCKIVPTRCNFGVLPTKHKVRTQFKVTIRRLKNKLTQSSRERRRLKAIISRRDAHIVRLERKVAQLELITKPDKLKEHHYPIQMIALAVFIVTQANGSLRCAAKTAGFFATMMGWEYAAPSHVMVDNWTRRLGLYALDHAESLRGKYVGIIDESIQIGREKLLLFLLVKLEDLSSLLRPLTMADTIVLGAEVRTSWPAEDVAAFIQKRLERHPDLSLQYMISDQGTNLKAATESLSIDAVNDCSHVLMNALKKELAEDEVLQEVTKFMGGYRRKNILSERTHLCPPTLRDKDRFLKIFIILDWVARLNSYVNLSAAYRATLSFLYEPKVLALLADLTQARRIVSISTQILKTSGINAASNKAWLKQLADYRREVTLCPLAETLVRTVDDYFARHADLLAKYGRLICCSDIIESTFGRYKNKKGMKVISADVLHIPLYSLSINADFVRRGLSTVHQRDIREWHFKNTCDNRYSMLHRLRKEAETVTQTVTDAA